MGLDPNQAPQYLEGVEYPASKEDLAAAEKSGAPEDSLQRSGTLGWPTFESADEVVVDPQAPLSSG